jgi:hypothetical protein
MRKQAISCWLILIKNPMKPSRQAEELKRQGAERIILDLRGNRRLAQRSGKHLQLICAKVKSS